MKKLKVMGKKGEVLKTLVTKRGQALFTRTEGSCRTPHIADYRLCIYSVESTGVACAKPWINSQYHTHAHKYTKAYTNQTSK